EGSWQRLRISGEMLMGRAHHVIYFASPEAWLAYPEWARYRRDEIIARIKSEFRAPDYEYYGDGSAPAPAVSTRAPAAVVPPVPSATRAALRAPRAAHRSQIRALLLAIAIMLSIGAGMGWLVAEGVADGDTWLPTPRTTQRRVVVRAQEPAAYWLSLGIYGALGAGAFGLAGWGIRHAVR